MVDNEKYILDEKLLAQIEERTKSPNGNEEFNLVIPLLYSIYGHIREIDRNIILFNKNPMVWIGSVIQNRPVIAGFIGLLLLVVFILMQDPTNFAEILGYFGIQGIPTPTPTYTPNPDPWH